MRHTYDITIRMLQGQCEKCEDRGETHGRHCLVRKLIFDALKPKPIKATPTQAMDAAVIALDLFLKKRARKMDFRDDVSSEKNSNFLKLKDDKQSVIGLFQGHPYDFRHHWIKNGQSTKSELCTGKDCKYCADGLKSSFRFRLNFVMFDPQSKSYYAMIFEQGLTVYETLRSLNKDYPLDSTVLRITRNGTGNNTTYLILPVPGKTLNDENKQKITEVKLHDLIKLDEPAHEEAVPAAAFEEF